MLNIKSLGVKAGKLEIAPTDRSRQMIEICVSAKRREAEHAEESAEFFCWLEMIGLFGNRMA
jgi:hypothetical protein